jgi:hypothetical protein
MRDSVKRGCKYRFVVKEYTLIPGTAIIKFGAEGMEVGSDLCSTMLHVAEDGLPAHEGLGAHVPHSDEMRLFVTDWLKAGCQVKVIRDGAPHEVTFCTHVRL